MIKKRVVWALVVMVSRCEFVEASSAVRLLSTSFFRGRVLTVLPPVSSISSGATQNMKEEKLKAMSNLFLEYMYSELGKSASQSCGQEDATVDSSYYVVVGKEWMENATHIYPGVREQVNRDHREYLEILKVYCSTSYARDLATEKKIVRLFVPRFVEQILKRVKERKEVAEESV
jgi:hypothetical protein